MVVIFKSELEPQVVVELDRIGLNAERDRRINECDKR